MKQIFILLAAGAASILLNGCVSAPKAELRGAMPAGGTFFMAGPTEGPADLERIVRDRLVERGLTEARGGAYLVQATLSERGLSSGMAVSSEPQWLRAPLRGSGHLVQFSVTITRAADGTEVFRATSSKRNGRQDARTIDRLVDVAFTRVEKEPAGSNVAAPR